MTNDVSIPLFKISWDERDVEYATESITRGSYWAKGPFVSAFEEGLAEYVGTEHAIVVNSGTTALVAALHAHGIGEGDEVIVPSFTFIATANAVRLVGARPVFADIERTTYGLDPASVREAITDRTAAVIPVHLYGTPCRIGELVSLAEEHELAVIEDAAEAFGAEFNGKPVGTFGDSAILSFCQNKVLATGEGGAVITDDAELADEVQRYRSHGRTSANYFESTGSGEYASVGTNYRVPDVVAAIGCAQLEKVDDLITARQQAASTMNTAFGKLPDVEVPNGMERATHVYQLYTITLPTPSHREAVIETLTNRNIASKIYWDPPVHRTTAYQDSHQEPLPELSATNEVSSRVLSLPLYPDISAEDTERIVRGVRDALENP
ncbi:DegT/DnrJ/EryC1/StrS family aminotransferase [Natrialbaceae archaeon A-CW1-1]